ncbi:MAG TPA: hypothetical protein PLI09_27555 [Candidatus Hydrogenedentes bacterium]|nr:hypothetical protein [Candidatus Hydrogenedentota bacterium]
MFEILYCDSWFWKRRKSVDDLSEAEACQRHKKRKEYTAVLGGFEHPSIVVEVVNRMVAVTYLDRLLRMERTLKFQEKKPEHLFLTMAIRRRYCEATAEMIARLESGRKDPGHPWGQFLADADRVLDGRTIVFNEDGSTLYRASKHGDSRQLVQPGPQCDVTANWEPYPEFGHYDHLLKQRDLPWGPGLDDASDSGLMPGIKSSLRKIGRRINLRQRPK